MKFLRFFFTARMGFVLFVFLAFMFTLLYLAWNQRHEAPVVTQKPRVGQPR